MYGFKPRHAQGKPVQNLADGGIVHSLTGMLGMRKRTPEEMLAADAKVQERNREAAARVAARAKPAQPAAPAEGKAISDYAGMSAMQRREQAAGLKDGGTVGGFKPGGLIRGPGTGTSDSIKTEKRPGTFIMPADSTQAIGPEALERLGESEEMEVDDEEGEESVPVRLSNGEFEVPPEQVQALGQAVLTVLRDATHTPVGESKPVAGGFAPNQFFANGGTVFGARGLDGMRAMIPKMEAMGYPQADKRTPAVAPGSRNAADLKALIPTMEKMGYPQALADGGMVQDDERLKRVTQIPTGSDVRAPASDGQGSTELTRNVNNGLNALGGLGVVASVPLRAGQAAKAAATGSGATALPSGIPRLTGPAQAAAAPAADFVAGMGPGATTYANTIPRIGNAPTPVLPGTNAALQQGAQANVMSAATRTASGANAGATALDSTQRNNPAPATAPATAPAAATPSEYGRQMSAVGGALVDGAAWLGKTIVSAPGYGFNKPSAAPAPAGATATAGAGRGSINPASVNPTQPAAAATEQTNAVTDTAAVPTQPPTNEVMPGVYRYGRGQYSDNAAGMAMPPGFTGQPNAQNMAAADALVARQTPAGFQPAGSQLAGVQAPVVRNSTNDWAARKALANAETAASSITNTRRWGGKGAENSPDVQAYQAMLKNDLALQQAQPGMDKAAMDGNTALQREGIQQAGATGRTAMQEQGANTRDAGRNALTAEELGLRREAQGFQTRAAAKLESLQNAYAAEKDPAKQAILARQIREFQGKEQPARYKVAAGGQQIDANGVAYKVPDRVFNEQTGEFADVRGAAAPAPIAAPKAGEVRNGYRFKGGNPNDQANWTKV